MTTQAQTQTRERTLPEIEAELKDARAQLAAAEDAERQASERVTASREGFALGQLARRALLTVQRSLADAQEATEQAKARVRALEKLSVAAHARADDAARREKAERDRLLRLGGERLAAEVGVALARMENELHVLWMQVDAHHTEVGSYAPATDRYRTRAWALAGEGLRGLRSQYPVAAVTTIPTRPATEGAPSA